MLRARTTDLGAPCRARTIAQLRSADRIDLPMVTPAPLSDRTKNSEMGQGLEGRALCSLWAGARGVSTVDGGGPQVHSAAARSAVSALEPVVVCVQARTSLA